jgi:hypothetical protein
MKNTSDKKQKAEDGGKKYRCNAGVEFERDGATVRYEPGDVAGDLPAESLPWLLEQGIVSDVPRAAVSASAPAGSPATVKGEE